MAPPIRGLSRDQQQTLPDGLNYLNIDEICSFCNRHSIPYRIVAETRDGRTQPTGDRDRKGIMLDRVRHFLSTGEILNQTRIPAAVMPRGPLPRELTAATRLYYRQYDKRNRRMMALLAELTDGTFRHGAVARMLAREYWTEGKAPTIRQFASAWLLAMRKRTGPNPEWAFLSDRASKRADANWKALRATTARRVLKQLERY